MPQTTTRQLRGAAVAVLIANIGIVVTGGAVRLTDSGLGCPRVPMCTDESMVPHPETGIHGYIEFGNRLMTFVVGAAVLLLLVSAWRHRPRMPRVTTLALVVLAGIPGQALVGMVTVWTALNPWVVMLHFLLSMVLIVLSSWIVRLTREAPVAGTVWRRTVPKPARVLTVVLFVATCALVYAGTVVTASGPHAGDEDARRTGLDLALVSQLHADLAFLVIGLAVGTLLMFRATRAPRRASRTARILLGLLLAQGAIGYVQYFTNLPELLVGLHMLGAALVLSSVTTVLLSTREARHPTESTAVAGDATAEEPVSAAGPASLTPAS